MTFEQARLIVDGLVEAGMVHPTAKLEIMLTMVALVHDEGTNILKRLSRG